MKDVEKGVIVGKVLNVSFSRSRNGGTDGEGITNNNTRTDQDRERPKWSESTEMEANDKEEIQST